MGGGRAAAGPMGGGYNQQRFDGSMAPMGSMGMAPMGGMGMGPMGGMGMGQMGGNGHGDGPHGRVRHGPDGQHGVRHGYGHGPHGHVRAPVWLWSTAAASSPARRRLWAQRWRRARRRWWCPTLPALLRPALGRARTPQSSMWVATRADFIWTESALSRTAALQGARKDPIIQGKAAAPNCLLLTCGYDVFPAVILAPSHATWLQLLPSEWRSWLPSQTAQ